MQSTPSTIRTPTRPDAKMAEVECLQEAVRKLVEERQALQDRNAGRAELESNRLELVGKQRQLSYALIARYRRPAEPKAA
jgi:hypothetical protein